MLIKKTFLEEEIGRTFVIEAAQAGTDVWVTIDSHVVQQYGDWTFVINDCCDRVRFRMVEDMTTAIVEDSPPPPRLVRLAGMHETIIAAEGQIIDWWPPSAHCPECGQLGRERSGAEFQNQNRCSTCGHIWSPYTGYLRIRQNTTS